MSESKKIPKKLRNGPTVLVDPQVIRWRQKLRKEGIKLGKAMQRAEEARVAIKAERAKPEPAKRKWFE